jgi:hypothetical protein
MSLAPYVLAPSLPPMLAAASERHSAARRRAAALSGSHVSSSPHRDLLSRSRHLNDYQPRVPQPGRSVAEPVRVPAYATSRNSGPSP